MNLKTMTNAVVKPVANEAKGLPNPIILDQKTLAASVGGIAFCLPWILYAGSWIGPFCTQASISHYYFLPILGSVFVALMGFIGVFMLSYKGHTLSDRIMAIVGGVLALIVAVFPTAGDGCMRDDYTARIFRRAWLPPGDENALFDRFVIDVAGYDLGTNQVHLSAAVVLFLILAWFALVSFRRDNGEGVWRIGTKAQSTPQKHRRNIAYTMCGTTILVCIAVLGFLPDSSDGYDGALPPFFLAEAVALMAFGLSWFIKGRRIPWFNDPLPGHMRA